jgi:hypothetical protein
MTLTFKIKRAIIRATSVTAVIFTLSLALQLYLTRWYRAVEPVKVVENAERPDASAVPSATIWDLMKDDPSISMFIKRLEALPRVIEGLASKAGQFTVYAPTNEAFEKEHLPYDMPSFGWMMLVGYHMGQGAHSREDLMGKSTVSSFLHADRFFKYKQRISTQAGPDGIVLNFKAKVLESEVVVPLP